MAWTTPFTASALGAWTAALWNTHVRDNLLYLYGLATVRRLNTNVTANGNDSTTETDLMSYTLLGGTLSADGMAVELVACGTSANNANVKTLRVYVGATAVLTTTVQPSAVPWRVRLWVVRTGAATQVGTVEATGVATTGVEGGTVATTATLANDLTLKITGQSDTAGDDLTQTAMTVLFIP